MKKLFFIFYAISISLLFFNESLSMHPDKSLLSPEEYAQIATAATAYNNNHPLLDEMFSMIFPLCCDKENAREEFFVENFVNLTNTSNACKKFKQLFKIYLISNTIANFITKTKY